MNTSRPVPSAPGQPIGLLLENVPFAHMLGDRIRTDALGNICLTVQQRIIIEAKLREASRDGVPLVIVLWPQNAPKITGLEPDRVVRS